MQLVNAPSKIVLPFANAGAKNTIPTASQIGITPGAASLTDGFPPLTRTPLAAGGVPPSGLDMNGILFELAASIRWGNAGAGFTYDSAFASDSNVTGYPKGARVLRTDSAGYWLNKTDGNTTDPEGAGAAAAGWVPDYTNGVTAITMTSANVTLTPLQYGKPIITITGLLTANLNLIFPDIADQWVVINNTTGAYSITAKTAAGTGVAVSGVQQIVGDGTNIYSSTSSAVSSSTPKGSFSNMVGAWASNTTATWTADQVVLQNGTNVCYLASSVNNTLNTATSGAGGLDSGSTAANTWYYVWLIYNGTVVNILMSLSSTAPTLPSGYTYKARIGSIFLDGSKNIRGFSQKGRDVTWVVGSNLAAAPIIISGSYGSTTTPTWQATALTSFVPTTASKIKVSLWGVFAGPEAMCAPNANYGSYASTTNPPPIMIANSAGSSTGNSIPGEFVIESSNIYYAANSANAGLSALGYTENL